MDDMAIRLLIEIVQKLPKTLVGDEAAVLLRLSLRQNRWVVLVAQNLPVPKKEE